MRICINICKWLRAVPGTQYSYGSVGFYYSALSTENVLHCLFGSCPMTSLLLLWLHARASSKPALLPWVPYPIPSRVLKASAPVILSFSPSPSIFAFRLGNSHQHTNVL